MASMKLRNPAPLILLSAFILAGAGFALAWSQPADAGATTATTSGTTETSITVSGRLVSHMGNSLVIATDDGPQMTFVLDQGVAPPDGLQSGDRVSLEYRRADGGDNLAMRVTREVGGAPASSDDTASPAASSPATSTGSPEAGNRHRAGSMPHTASTLPLVALIGAGALGAGAALALFGRRAV